MNTGVIKSLLLITNISRRAACLIVYRQFLNCALYIDRYYQHMMCTKLQDLTVVKFSWGKTSGLSDVVRRLPKVFLKVPKLPLHHCGDVLCVSVGKSDGEESSDDDSDSSDQEQQTWLAELNWRRKHPECLHEELWFNLPQEVCLQ